MHPSRRVIASISIAALSIVISGRAAATPIKVQPIAVTASSSVFGSPPQSAIDGDPSTQWNSGSYQVAWIQLDLGRPISISKIRLLVAQGQFGATDPLQVYVGADQSSWRLAYTRNMPTSDGQWIELSGDGDSGDRLGNVRYVRINDTNPSSYVAWREIEVYQGMEYFGFYGDHAGADYTSETTANGANLNYIDFASPADLGNRLAEVKAYGNKAIVATNVLFDSTRHLRPDWQSQWYAMRDAIYAGGFQDTVAAFWLYEEPYWVSLNIIPKAMMRDWLTEISSQIKSDFPSTPTALLVSVPELIGTDLSLDGSYVAMADWVGFDSYDTWYTGCVSPAVSPTTRCISNGASGGMCALINTLRSWLGPNQRMMAFPASALNLTTSFTGSSSSVQYFMIDTNINMWQQEMLSDAKYVAAIPFLWQSEIGFQGARDTPRVKKQMFEMAYGLIPRGTSHVFPISYSASGTYGATAPTQPPTASSYSDWSPAAAFDLDASTSWNAGWYPSQWIQANLAGTTRVSRIDLTTNQTPAGQTLHGLWGLTPNGWTWLATFQSATADSQTLTWTGSVDISAIQVETAQGPSWVGWRDIQIYQ